VSCGPGEKPCHLGRKLFLVKSFYQKLRIFRSLSHLHHIVYYKKTMKFTVTVQEDLLSFWRMKLLETFLLHCEKSLFVLAFHQKIPLPRIENPAADTRKFFPPPIDLIHNPHGRKFFGSLEGDFLHSHMPEKSSGPWNETFYTPPCHKSLAP
jgi:hypothetical protein